jgi:hypothetical protein
MTTIAGVRLDADGNTRAIIDASTQESIARWQPVVLDEDFVGAGHSAIPAHGSPATGYPWVDRLTKTSGNPTVAIVANSAAGIVALAIDATSEKQEATLYANDQLNWDVTKNLQFEARVAFSVLPTGLAEMVFGLQSAWIDGPDNASEYLRFQALASGAVNCQCDDNITPTSVASGVTLVAGAFHVFHIDASNLADIVYTIDGVRVNAVGSVGFAATGSAAILQPYASVYKASGTGLGTMQVDMVQVATDRV